MHTVKRTDSSTLRWHVMRGDKFIQRCHTKRQAALLAAVLDGDMRFAPDLYRETLKHSLRSSPTREEALRSAVFSMAVLGLGSSEVRADPETGEPLP